MADTRNKTEPKPPKLTRELEPIAIAQLEHDDSFAESILADADLSSQDARGVTLQTMRLTNVNLAGARLDQLTVTDVELRGCDLANVRAERTTASRVRIEGGRLTGLTLARSTLRDLVVSGCRIDLASFAGSKLQRVTFEDCLLAQTDFIDAQLERVRFIGCNLREADLRGARFSHSELRHSELAGIHGAASLRGIAMEWTDVVQSAGVFAAALGVEILDEQHDRV